MFFHFKLQKYTNFVPPPTQKKKYADLTAVTIQSDVIFVNVVKIKLLRFFFFFLNDKIFIMIVFDIKPMFSPNIRIK